MAESIFEGARHEIERLRSDLRMNYPELTLMRVNHLKIWREVIERHSGSPGVSEVLAELDEVIAEHGHREQ